ncbi:MAG: S53 family peptidase [Thaumarchaeota archaeon]|nr:S53 family peptidase [Nitrososphaerota archaeon]
MLSGPVMIMFVLMMGSPVIAYASVANDSSSQSASTTWVPSPLAQPATPTCSPTGLCPSMLLKAYDVTSLQSAGTNGTGQTVVIVDACGSPTIAADLKTFDKHFSLANPTLNIINPQGTPCVNSGWGVETSLDVEWSHVMAPGATIDLLQAASASSANLYGAWSYSLSHSLGNEISNSWGGSGACSASVKSILATAKTDHVTVLASAGDSGAWGQGTTQKEQNPADCAKVLTVGGTTLTVTGTGSYVSESAWGSACISGTGTGGGGVTGVSEPSYQSSVHITEPWSAPAVLAKPDVSAVADPCTGVWVYDSTSGGWLVIGGTSVSCPLWAGFMADVNQVRAGNGFAAAGFVNSFLYTKVYGVSGTSVHYAADIHDVTTGSNGWPAGPGWDAATGIGSFIATPLAHTLGTSASA